ncbi:tetratricopeptide repeat protein [Pinisolibacter sp. B13]|uniref:tetratricopeptide repeat protein n=1 Tax=Pinisolibacter aquiterrae TaxID=2815579 RepID=UPI001C3DBB42|nr:tetratricopeptide repeat protein [Pinisolibacter aquiterrae]MBV5265055.1 tetratricopeptide repeat protein [Pinisolibacter aquiterrae]
MQTVSERPINAGTSARGESSLERAVEAIGRGDFRTAEEIYLARLEHDPTDERAQTGLVEICERSDRLEDALVVLDVLTRRTTDNLRWIMWSAKLELRLGRTAEAEGALLSVFERDPAYPGAAYELAGLYQEAGRQREAAAIVLKGAKARPNDGSLWLKCGELLVSLGNLAVAEVAFDRAAALMDDETEALARRLEVLMALDRQAEAYELLERLVAARPDDILRLSQLAQLSEDRDEAKAIRLYRRVLELDPTQTDAARRLSELVVEPPAQPPTEATPEVADAGAAMSAPDVDEDMESARAEPVRAPVTPPQEPTQAPVTTTVPTAPASPQSELGALLRQARALQVDHAFEDAKIVLSKVLAIDPHHSSAQRQLAVLLRRQGQKQDAETAFAAVSRSMRVSLPPSFIDGLHLIERRLGLPHANADVRRIAQGLLPDRSEWPDERRFLWGRQICDLINNWVLFRPFQFAEIARFTDGFDWIEHGDVVSPGSVLIGTAVGAGHGALGALIRSRRPYRTITANDEMILSSPRNTIDGRTDYPSMATEELVGLLEAGTDLLINGDGGIGTMARRISVDEVPTRLVEDPYRIAFEAGRPAHVYMAVFTGMKIHLVLDPLTPPTLDQSYEDWLEKGLERYENRYRWALEQGPENRRTA